MDAFARRLSTATAPGSSSKCLFDIKQNYTNYPQNSLIRPEAAAKSDRVSRWTDRIEKNMAEIREFGGGFHIGEKDKIPTIPGVGMEGEAGFNFKCFLFLPERYKEGELTVILLRVLGIAPALLAIHSSVRRNFLPRPQKFQQLFLWKIGSLIIKILIGATLTGLWLALGEESR